MTEVQISPRPDTTDMMAVHEVFRQALASAPTLLGDDCADAARAATVATYYDNVLRFLRVHHDSEDHLIWPKLLERCPAQEPLITEMISDHQGIHDALDRAAASVAGFAATATAGTAETAAAAGTSAPTGADGAAALVSALSELGQDLIPHLDNEEKLIVPLCSEYLSIEEWGEMPGHALGNYDGDKVWLILGLIRQHMTQAQRDAMLEHMPPPARDMWVQVGEAAFHEFIGGLHDPLAVST